MAQIDALPPSDRALVRRAGLLGSTFPPDLAGTVLGPAASTLTRLEGIFSVTPDGHLRFRRAVLREAAVDGVPYAERRLLHAKIADALESGTAGPVDPGVLAAHYRGADRHDRAHSLARVAARRAAARSAPADAADLYRMALDCARVVGLDQAEQALDLEGLGHALRLSGQTAAADRAYRQARQAIGADPLRQAELMHRQARLAHRAGHPAAGVRWARRARRTLQGIAGPEADAWRARLLATEAADRMDQGRTAEAVRLCRQALDLAAATPGELAERARAHAGYLVDWALVVLGRGAEAVHSAAALEVYDRLGEHEEKAKVLNNLGMFAYWAGRWDEAVARYDQCGELAERIGDVETVACARANVGEVLADQGHWEPAAEALAEASRIWRASGNAGGAGFVAMLQGRLAARAGRYEEGISTLESAVEQLRADGMEDAAVAQTYLIEALAYAGQEARAVELIGLVESGAGRVAAPLLRRCAALARRDEGVEAVVAGLAEAVRLARETDNDFEAALSLDLLVALSTDPEQRRDDASGRDELFGRLGISRAAAPQWLARCR
jgi:tetratricopeptide (TPR) repeat protein